jgi:hypothetical protein
MQEWPGGVPFWDGSLPTEHTIGYLSWGTSNDESVVTIWGPDNQEVMVPSYFMRSDAELGLRQDQPIKVEKFP